MTDPIWELFIPIIPIAKAYRQSRGRLILSDDCRRYQSELTSYASKFAPESPFDGYLGFAATFYMPRLEGQKNRLHPNSKPDLDNTCKALLDGLERAGVFINDSRFVDGLLKKRYVGDGGVSQPGTLIRIYRVAVTEKPVSRDS